jgi:hypothetical protein
METDVSKVQPSTEGAPQRRPPAQCESLAWAKDRDYPVILLRCMLYKNHRGAHKAVEKDLDWEWRPLAGPAVWLKGDAAAFAWFNGRGWWAGLKKFIGTEDEKSAVEPEFTMAEIEETKAGT